MSRRHFAITSSRPSLGWEQAPVVGGRSPRVRLTGPAFLLGLAIGLVIGLVI